MKRREPATRRPKREPGRPPMLDDAEVVAGHLPRDLVERFKARCAAERMSRAEGLRQAIAAWLGGCAAP